MKKLLFTLTLFSGITFAQERAPEACMKPWLFFDLGNTLVDTKTHSYNPIFYLRDVAAKNSEQQFIWKDGAQYANAQDYIEQLSKEAFVLGMITDVPEAWGLNYPAIAPIKEYRSAKIFRLFDFLAGRVPEDNTSWKDDVPEFDYLPFGKFVGEGPDQIFQGELLLPQKDTERKSPNAQGVGGSPILFERALARAQEKGCPAIYQGEDTNEMKLAEAAGLFPFHVGKTSKNYYYLPADKFSAYIESYTPGQWESLGENDFE